MFATGALPAGLLLPYGQPYGALEVSPARLVVWTQTRRTFVM